MKQLFLIFSLMWIAQTIQAQPLGVSKSEFRDAAVTTIETTYTDANGFVIDITDKSELTFIWLGSDTIGLCWNFSVPANCKTDTTEDLILTGPIAVTVTALKHSGKIHVRSRGAAITSGSLQTIVK